MDEQLELLRGIWNEMKTLNGRITKTNESLGELRTEVRDGIRGLTERVDAVHSRAVERDLRLAGDLRDLKLDVRDLKNVAFAWHDEHRADRTNLQERVERLERHVGIERA
jgi:uncharacterized protein YkvS